jgi:hypothetical protein
MESVNTSRVKIRENEFIEKSERNSMYDQV